MKPRNFSLSLVAVLAVAFAATAATRRLPKTMSFDQLVGAADVIVLARVESVDVWTARAIVLEQWKGERVASVVYNVRRMHACDMSAAIAGETAVLCLSDWEAGRRIIHEGRGRWPIRIRDERQIAELSLDALVIPPDLPTEPDPDAKHDMLRLIELSKLKSAVAAALDTRISLADLAAMSDSIALGSIAALRLLPESEGLRYSIAVAETWKGEKIESIEVNEPLSWPALWSEIESGDSVVVFLGPKDSKGVRTVSNLGRGRMRVEPVESRRVALVWSRDVMLPASISTELPPADCGLLRPNYFTAIDLALLRAAVTESVDGR